VGNIGSELAGLVPLALVVAASPLTVIPTVLMLHTTRPRPTGLAYLLGWLVGMVALTGFFVEVPELLGGLHMGSPRLAWVRIVVGTALIALGSYAWVTRHTRSHEPKWLRQFTEASPRKGFFIAVLLTVLNPKVLFVGLAAGLSIGTSTLDRTGKVIVALAFVVMSISSVIVPIVAYLIAGDRLEPALARLKAWMDKHNASIVAVVLLVIGAMVLYKGIHGL
jgi:arginine exporter protein ArgO